MRKLVLFLLTVSLFLCACEPAPPPPEPIDEETALTLALEEARKYAPLGLEEDSALCELTGEQPLYRITFEPDPMTSGTRVTILIDPYTGGTVDVLLGE